MCFGISYNIIALFVKKVQSDVTCYDAFLNKRDIGKAWKYQWKCFDLSKNTIVIYSRAQFSKITQRPYCDVFVNKTWVSKA